jgi:hypothetical protein
VWFGFQDKITHGFEVKDDVEYKEIVCLQDSMFILNVGNHIPDFHYCEDVTSHVGLLLFTYLDGLTSKIRFRGSERE